MSCFLHKSPTVFWIGIQVQASAEGCDSQMGFRLLHEPMPSIEFSFLFLSRSVGLYAWINYLFSRFLQRQKMLICRYSIQAVWKIVFSWSNTSFITAGPLGRATESVSVAVALLETCFLNWLCSFVISSRTSLLGQCCSSHRCESLSRTWTAKSFQFAAQAPEVWAKCKSTVTVLQFLLCAKSKGM